jgi:Protein of unknown function (DUF3723)
MKKMCFSDIQLLQSRAPGACSKDLAFLQNHFEAGRLFTSLPQEIRQLLWGHFRTRCRVMPSLFTFFKDFKYLCSLQAVVRELIEWPPITSLSRTLEAVYHANDPTQVLCEHHEQVFERRDTAPRDNFAQVYLQLWLFAMRHWWETTELNPRKGGKGRTALPPKYLLLPYLADLALQLGCMSSKIQEVANGPRSEALPATHASTYTVAASSMRRRCGVPFLGEQASDQGNLFLSRVLESGAAGGITSLFLRKCFISSFWFDLNVEVAAVEGVQVRKPLKTPAAD